MVAPGLATPGTLLPHQIKQIERALADVGEYGEVRLIKAKGKLRLPMPYLLRSAE